MLFFIYYFGDNMKIGIPRSINYYKNKYMWKYFFEKLGIEVILSPLTNRKIIKYGTSISNDEMCLSLKNYLGHINYLKDKCDYILIPRIDNYGRKDQTCTNFLSFYDIVNNLFDVKILNYDIDYEKGKNEYKAYLKLGKELKRSKKEIRDAYIYALIRSNKQLKKIYIEELNKLNKSKLKILIVGHDYNIEDELIGQPIIKYLKANDCEAIKSNNLPDITTNYLASQISNTLYWKYNKESIGAIPFCEDKIDGIILLSSFPCGPDSIVNELVLRRVNKPILNLIIDDLDSFSGIETRLESFIDIISNKIR